MELQHFCQEDCLASRIIRRAFARQCLKIMMSVMDRVRFMRWKACFLFLMTASQSFVHHGTDGFRQGLVFGMDNEAAFKIRVFKSW